MKKFLILIAMAITIISLTACSTGSTNSNNDSVSGSSVDQSVGSSTPIASTGGGNGGSKPTQSTVNSSVGGNVQNSTQVSGNGQNSTQPGSSQTNGNTSVETPSNGEVVEKGSVKILSSFGGMETAYATWEKGSSNYVAYVKEANGGTFSKIDDQLIRQYPDYFRVDVLGLKKGNYQIKIVPTNGSTELSNEASIVEVSVDAHKREGFAFSSQSPNKTASGAYNDDGTLKQNAQVLYITKDNVNTITLDVIKDSKGTKQTGTGLSAIMALRQKGYDKTPLAVRFIGQIKDSEVSGLNTSGYIQVKGCYNVTMEGVGSDATLYGWSFLVRAANNVEIRNFGIMMFKDDGISMDTDNNNIWVHNNDFFYGAPGSDADQVKGDGSCDNKKTSYITVSYNHFWDSGKAILCGMGDTVNYFATFHHNWFDHSDSRHPRIRVGTVHVYNNYYDGVSKYGIGATTGSSCFAESNYFLNTKKPMLISQQGTDIASGKGTFSGEAGGIIKAYGNVFQNTVAPVDYSKNQTDFDCYTVSNPGDKVPSTVKTKLGGTGYSNFDTDSTMYSYVADSGEIVPSVVKAYSGRVGGGDFKWTFTDSENTDYSVNVQLKNAIASYQTSLVKVGGTK